MDYRYYGDCRYYDSDTPRYHEEIKIKYVPQSPWFGGGRPSPPKVNYDTRFKNDSHYYY